MRRAAAILAVPITLAYPLAIWFGDGRVEPRFLAGALIIAGLFRLPATGKHIEPWWWWGGIAALGTLAIWFNALLPLKFYPVFVNVALFVVFAASLIKPPSVIERLARLRETNLPPRAVEYTKRVTQVWCGFFVINGAIALATTLWSPAHVWMLYNGIVAYLLMGLLFVGEHVVRSRFIRRYHG